MVGSTVQLLRKRLRVALRNNLLTVCELRRDSVSYGKPTKPPRKMGPASDRPLKCVIGQGVWRSRQPARAIRHSGVVGGPFLCVPTCAATAGALARRVIKPGAAASCRREDGSCSAQLRMKAKHCALNFSRKSLSNWCCRPLEISNTP